MKIVPDLQRNIRDSEISALFGGSTRDYFIRDLLIVSPTLSNLQRRNTLAIFSKVISVRARYRLAYVPPVCLWPLFRRMSSFALPVIPPRALADRFILLLTISFSRHFVHSETQCDVCAGQREEYRAVYRDLTTRPYFRLSSPPGGLS